MTLETTQSNNATISTTMNSNQNNNKKKLYQRIHHYKWISLTQWNPLMTMSTCKCYIYNSSALEMLNLSKIGDVRWCQSDIITGMPRVPDVNTCNIIVYHVTGNWPYHFSYLRIGGMVILSNKKTKKIFRQISIPLVLCFKTSWSRNCAINSSILYIKTRDKYILSESLH